MTKPLPAPLVAYLASRDAYRAERIRAVLGTFSTREHRLVQDAAVMGYVRGSLHPKGEEIPLNAGILADVLYACLSFPDLYPAIAADNVVDVRETAEYLVQAQQDDGTWEQCSSTTADAEYAAQRLAARQRMHPNVTCRLVRKTTTVVVEAAIEPDKEPTG